MSNLSDFIYKTENVSFKNKLINGNFSIWQRGTSFSGLAVYTADRWYSVYPDTITKETDGSLKIIGSNSASRINQKIEGSYLNGKTVTASVTMKSSVSRDANIYYKNSGGVGILVTLKDRFGSSTVTDTYKRFFGTFDVPTDGDGNYFEFNIYSSVSTTNFKDVQLEKGSKVTDFEIRPKTIEEKLCYRYYFEWNKSNKYFMNYGGGAGHNSYILTQINLPSEMRIKPLVTYAGIAGDHTIFPPGNQYIYKNGGMIFSTKGSTLNGACLSGIQFDAEL